MQPEFAKDARLEIQKLHELPPLPAFAAEFLRVVDDPGVEVRQLAHLIEQDPALLARIIGLANSAYFGLRHPVTDAEEAIFKVLGIATTKSLALGIVLSGPFDASRTPGFGLERYWFISVAAASLAQRLADALPEKTRPAPGAAYLCGLLHGIGKLALVHLYPAAMEQVFTHPEFDEQSVTALERKVLGVDHLQVGGWLARKWHLPPQVVAAIEHHENADYKGGHATEARLTGVSVELASRLEAGEQELQSFTRSAPGLSIAPARMEALIAEAIEDRDDLAAMAELLAAD